jgi:hypothetical protein
MPKIQNIKTAKRSRGKDSTSHTPPPEAPVNAKFSLHFCKEENEADNLCFGFRTITTSSGFATTVATNLPGLCLLRLRYQIYGRPTRRLEKHALTSFALFSVDFFSRITCGEQVIRLCINLNEDMLGLCVLSL